MPLYEFKCADCNHNFEELCPMGTTTVSCPKCQSRNTSRKISNFNAKSSGSDGTRSIGGGGCSSCHSGNCGSCH